MTASHPCQAAPGAGRKRLLVAILLGAMVSGVEAIGGLMSGSLALLADAGHVLTDVFGLTGAYLASHWASRPAGGRFTYGFVRLEPLAALANGLLLGAVAVSVVLAAVLRWGQAPIIEHRVVLSAACFGLAANTIGAVVLGGHARHNLNLRGAFLHLLADALGAFGVIVAALVMAVTGWTGADQIASLVVALVVGVASVRLTAQALNVLMQAAPSAAVVEEARALLASSPDVAEIPDLRVWTLGGSDLVVSACLVVGAHAPQAVELARRRLAARWPGARLTLEARGAPGRPAAELAP